MNELIGNAVVILALAVIVWWAVGSAVTGAEARRDDPPVIKTLSRHTSLG